MKHFVIYQEEGIKEIKRVTSLEDLKSYIFMGTTPDITLTGNPDFLVFEKDKGIVHMAQKVYKTLRNEYINREDYTPKVLELINDIDDSLNK
jgi:hypothetical protein